MIFFSTNLAFLWSKPSYMHNCVCMHIYVAVMENREEGSLFEEHIYSDNKNTTT